MYVSYLLIVVTQSLVFSMLMKGEKQNREKGGSVGTIYALVARIIGNLDIVVVI